MAQEFCTLIKLVLSMKSVLIFSPSFIIMHLNLNINSLRKASVSLLGIFIFISSACAETKSMDFWNNLDPCPSWLNKNTSANLPPNQPWDFSFSPYTLHWNKSSEHKPVVLVAIDRTVQGDRFCGLSLFTNSFGQPSVYSYVGQRWNPIDSNNKLFIKVTAGIIYGYVGKYKNEILNYGGFAPAIIPSFGYALTETDSVQVMILGTAGLTFAYSHRF
jgi:hypothetical protein